MGHHTTQKHILKAQTQHTKRAENTSFISIMASPDTMNVNYMNVPTTAVNSAVSPPMPGLFECTLRNFCCSCWCPCIASGQIAEAGGFWNMSSATGSLVYCCVDEAIGCAPCYHGLGLAQTLRKTFNVNAHESPLKTCCVHCWCNPCALSQELGFIDAAKQAGVY